VSGFIEMNSSGTARNSSAQRGTAARSAEQQRAARNSSAQRGTAARSAEQGQVIYSFITRYFHIYSFRDRSSIASSHDIFTFLIFAQLGGDFRRFNL